MHFSPITSPSPISSEIDVSFDVVDNNVKLTSKPKKVVNEHDQMYR